MASTPNNRKNDYCDIKNSRLSFVWKLHQMLCDAKSNGFQDICSWLPSGTAFRIHDCDAFVSKVMPLYFHQSKMKSFTRQLNSYGFSWVSKGPDRGAYYHDKFLEADKSACLAIVLNRKKRGKPKQRPAETRLPPGEASSSSHQHSSRSVSQEESPGTDFDPLPLHAGASQQTLSIPIGTFPTDDSMMKSRSFAVSVDSDFSMDPRPIEEMIADPSQNYLMHPKQDGR